MHIGGTVDSYVTNSNRTHFNVTNKVLVFDWTMEKWTELTSMSQSRWAAGCTTLPNGEILIGGGVSSLSCLNDGSSRNCNGNWLSNDALNTTEIFDPKTNSWKSGPALPKNITLGKMMMRNDTPVMIGGVSKVHGHYYNSILALESDQSKWINIGKLKHARYGHLGIFCSYFSFA